MQDTANTLRNRIEEVNAQISEDLKNVAAKQINDHHDNKVRIEEISNEVTANKQSIDEDIVAVKQKLHVHEERMERQERDHRVMESALHNANKEIHSQMLRIKELEKSTHRGLQHGRGWNVEIEGIPINVGDEPVQLQAATIKILQSINVPCETYEIDTVHRLPSTRNDSPKAVIVRFCSRKTVRLVHENKHKLKDLALLEIDIPGLNNESRIYINASQCPYYKTLAYNCRLLKRKGLIAHHFISRDGRITIKTLSEDFIKVTHESDLVDNFPLFREFSFNRIDVE